MPVIEGSWKPLKTRLSYGRRELSTSMGAIAIDKLTLDNLAFVFLHIRNNFKNILLVKFV